MGQTLTPRETKVLKLVCNGLRCHEIAKKLDLSAKTVETYRSRGLKKLGINTLPALVKYAIAKGMTSPNWRRSNR